MSYVLDTIQDEIKKLLRFLKNNKLIRIISTLPVIMIRHVCQESVIQDAVTPRTQTTIGKGEYMSSISQILAHTSTVVDSHLHVLACVPVVYVIYHTNISQCLIYKNFPSVFCVGRLW